MPEPELVPLTPEQKAKRAASFGGAAPHYERYRPGPPVEAADWLLPAPVRTLVDLGAGTGALTRLVVGRADEVVAVEPDDRMRAVLAESVPSARAVAGRGESIPLPDASADAVLASSSWHRMNPVLTLAEVGRVLVPGGTLAACVRTTGNVRLQRAAITLSFPLVPGIVPNEPYAIADPPQGVQLTAMRAVSHCSLTSSSS